MRSNPVGIRRDYDQIMSADNRRQIYTGHNNQNCETVNISCQQPYLICAHFVDRRRVASSPFLSGALGQYETEASVSASKIARGKNIGLVLYTKPRHKIGRTTAPVAAATVPKRD
jgi:hypothetical protein